MILVLDRHQNPLMPCSDKRARQLLDRGRASSAKGRRAAQGISRKYCCVIQRSKNRFPPNFGALAFFLMAKAGGLSRAFGDGGRPKRAGSAGVP